MDGVSGELPACAGGVTRCLNECMRFSVTGAARLLAVAVVAWAGAGARGSEAGFDRLAEALTVSSGDGRLRARLSGTLDLEGYAFSHPAPGLLDATGEALFNPRLSVFLDVQAGRGVYGFAQMRVDRGFDPGPRALRGRLDEYALRVTPWQDGRLSVQAGKFGTIVGNWVPRHGSWENPLVTAPLAYEQLTGIWDNGAPESLSELREWAHVSPRWPQGVRVFDKPLRLPLLWGPSYTTGVTVSGRWGRLTYAAELKDAALSSRPRVWNRREFEFRHPTTSVRLGYRPNAMWNLGVSASGGSYMRTDIPVALAPGKGRSDYRQYVVAQDVSFAWHHVQVWAEVFASRFEVPGIGDADLVSYYVEGKYKFTPRFFAAVRWNEQLYGKIADGRGARWRWGANTRRLDVGPVYRFSPHMQLKLQYSLQHDEVAERAWRHWVAGQFVVRF